MNSRHFLVWLCSLSFYITLSGQTGVGVNTDTIEGQLHISTNSGLGFPQVRLTEQGNDYARIKFENTQYSGPYWDLAGITGTDTTGSPRMNMFFYNGTSGRNLFSLLGDGRLLRNSSSENVYDFYYANNTYRGAIGFDSVDLRLLTTGAFGGKVRIGTKGRNNIIVDALGNVGIGSSPDTVKGELHITTNSVLGFPQVRLTEQGNDYARIKFENTGYPNSFWDLVAQGGTDSTGAKRLNFYYFQDSVGYNPFTFYKSGSMVRYTPEQFNFNYYYSDGVYRGLFGVVGPNFYMTTIGDSDGQIQIGTRGSADIVVDTVGNIGLGTSSPVTKLHIEGNQRVYGNLVLASFNGFGPTTIRDGFSYQLALDGNDIQSHYVPTISTTTLNLQPYGGSVNLSNGALVVNESSVQVENSINLYYGDQEYLRAAGSYTTEINGALIPVWDNLDDLGSSSFRWDDVYATNGTIQTSDRRDKTNITGLTYGLDAVLQLSPVSFEWKDSPHDNKKLGLVAQDVLEVIPEVVKTHDLRRTTEGVTEVFELERLGIYYSDMVPVLIKAIQDQHAIIESLQDENAELQETLLKILVALEEAGIDIDE